MTENKKLKVLIVEDEPVSRKLLEKLMEPYGSCQSAVNGQQAFMTFIAALEKGEPFDLVCLDIMLPEMNGQSVLSGIRNFEAGKGIDEKQAVKIIFTTGLVEAEASASKAKHILKPIDKNKIEKALRQLELVGG